MNPAPQLVGSLKQLRLSGILDSLENRNKQAIDEGLSFTEFLGLLIQDEVARREQKKYSGRFRRACFRGDKTLENFDFRFNPGLNQQLIRDLATCRFIDEKANVLIAGPCGTGKSHVAQALGHVAIRNGHEVLFVTQSKMLAQLVEARGKGLYQRKITQFIQVDLLIIDDFGLRPLENKQEEDFHEIVSERYETKSTIITSNLEYSEWGAAFPNRLLGVATLDRLRHGAYRVTLEGESYRAAAPAERRRNLTTGSNRTTKTSD
jgi:DNA replication protein DnaC